MPIIQAAHLEQLVTDIFLAASASSDEARIVATHLVEANLAGHDSHGVIRVPQYTDAIKAGLLRPGAPMEVVHQTATTAVLD
ncbi:MAG: Ldh family oxidoreductase, partial [Deinococcus sp.]|nr:Ldh family oxidoreductase [Deinococcus sp.]